MRTLIFALLVSLSGCGRVHTGSSDAGAQLDVGQETAADAGVRDDGCPLSPSSSYCDQPGKICTYREECFKITGGTAPQLECHPPDPSDHNGGIWASTGLGCEQLLDPDGCPLGVPSWVSCANVGLHCYYNGTYVVRCPGQSGKVLDYECGVRDGGVTTWLYRGNTTCDAALDAGK